MQGSINWGMNATMSQFGCPLFVAWVYGLRLKDFASLVTVGCAHTGKKRDADAQAQAPGSSKKSKTTPDKQLQVQADQVCSFLVTVALW